MSENKELLFLQPFSEFCLFFFLFQESKFSHIFYSKQAHFLSSKIRTKCSRIYIRTASTHGAAELLDVVSASAEHLERLLHYESADLGVGGGDGRDDVAGHALDVEARLAGNVEGLASEVGHRHHEIESGSIVLIPGQMISLRLVL